MEQMRTFLATLSLIPLLTACSDGVPDQVEQGLATQDIAEPSTDRTVFVQLFEWSWPAVAQECEQFLGPAGYAAVQVSPANEHIPGDEWWVRYQPVSYVLTSRSGDREQFADMVQRCKASGVEIYADAVINHMAMVGTGSGVAGSTYAPYEYPVPYSRDDFHDCGRNSNNTIQNYQDLWEVQNCELSTLADLATGKAAVQKKIAAYLNDLLDLGVAGFRIDAAKHMSVADIAAILDRLDRPAHIYQEVIDRGGEPINAHDYLPNGLVSEFKYPLVLLDAFESGDLSRLQEFAAAPGFLPGESAVVFVDNHDIQRGHAGADDVLNYKDGELYELAVAFMLAAPYGNPMVMSSYRFDDGDQGPPASAPIDAETSACDAAWVCEHRNPTIAGMVGFRNHTNGSDLNNWQLIGDAAVAFGRGERGFVVINSGGETIESTLRSNMPAGSYCNALSNCEDTPIVVQRDGNIAITLGPRSVLAVRTD